jgi:hypothetical protein
MATGAPSAFPVAGGIVLDSEEKRDAGLAIRTTPKSEMYAAICSIRVNRSFKKNEHAQQDSEGARKVITVASARGRY